MDQYTSDAKNIGGIQQAQAGVAHQGPADAASLIASVDRQST